MSHSKQRVEKVCLNCGAALTDRYCQQCGQENTEPKETVWALVSHFFNDITHFDGKFFNTVKYLVTKPGFLSAEYIKGRRAGYLHPIRMYVFTSAFFFIVFFSLFNPNDLPAENKSPEEQLKELATASSSLKEKLPLAKDTVQKAAILRAIKGLDSQIAAKEKMMFVAEKEDSLKGGKEKIAPPQRAVKTNINPGFTNETTDSMAANANNAPFQVDDESMNYRSKIAYDAVQQALPVGKRDGWFRKGIINRVIIYKTKYKDDAREARVLIMEKLMHMVPQALFVSLPVFALILMMLYARNNFFYADHAIFTIHFYCAAFLILILYFSIDRMQSATGWAALSLFKNIFLLALFFYLYKALRNFYQQGRMKTIFKFMLLNLFSLIVVIILSVTLAMLSLVRFS
ncbi:MAG: DUF3667 domain-containing protein [Chitinophagaceae bacterium]